MSAYAETVAETLAETVTRTMDIHIRDVAGQRPYRARGLRFDLSIGDLVRSLAARMNLPKVDASGQPHSYHAYLGREARHLHATERVGVALQAEDEIVLQPDIQAG